MGEGKRSGCGARVSSGEEETDSEDWGWRGICSVGHIWTALSYCGPAFIFELCTVSWFCCGIVPGGGCG
ncbi:hypothetical protein SUGI_0226380 [Cryptomeria japonica]|nr:hypothetical protein SUGI_0226380 [Cryptomeria japonica]